MADDLESMFAEAFDEAGSFDGESDDIPQNADINMGDDDDDSSFDLDDDSDSSDDESTDSSGVDNDGEDDTDDGATDESGFDWDTVKDQTVTVKVNGEDITVSLEELKSGYMRQSDYTRKTQAAAQVQRAAEWATQLQQAFQQDPQGALEYLARISGVQMQVAKEADPFDDLELDPEMAPLVSMLRQQQAEIRNLREAAETITTRSDSDYYLQEAQRELWEVKQEFPEMNEREVLERAATHEITIRDAYLMIQGEQAIKNAQAAAKAKADAEKIAERTEKKRKAAGKTLKGASAPGKAKSDEPDFDSFEEMLLHEMSKSR